MPMKAILITLIILKLDLERAVDKSAPVTTRALDRRPKVQNFPNMTKIKLAELRADIVRAHTCQKLDLKCFITVEYTEWINRLLKIKIYE